MDGILKHDLLCDIVDKESIKEKFSINKFKIKIKNLLENNKNKKENDFEEKKCFVYLKKLTKNEIKIKKKFSSEP